MPENDEFFESGLKLPATPVAIRASSIAVDDYVFDGSTASFLRVVSRSVIPDLYGKGFSSVHLQVADFGGHPRFMVASRDLIALVLRAPH